MEGFFGGMGGFPIENTMGGTLIASLLGSVIVKVLFTWLIAYVVHNVTSKALTTFFRKRDEKLQDTSAKRQNVTLAKLAVSFSRYIIYGIALITIVGFFIDITALLMSVGVLGLAIGFGAQGLVKDVVTGFFILFENQYAVGDRVKINGVEGKVAEL
ncbi:MAG: mechanosensitive ion channel family protein, partial [Bacilli bacterium]